MVCDPTRRYSRDRMRGDRSLVVRRLNQNFSRESGNSSRSDAEGRRLAERTLGAGLLGTRKAMQELWGVAQLESKTLAR